jgi:hypothetical protein
MVVGLSRSLIMVVLPLVQLAASGASFTQALSNLVNKVLKLINLSRENLFILYEPSVLSRDHPWRSLFCKDFIFINLDFLFRTYNGSRQNT